jgi:predicted O-methyltransferase YrrM
LTGGGSSLPEVQALLRVLAAGRRVAETGTAFGEGAAAMAETAHSVVTVERDPERAALARERLRDFDNVEPLEGDWRELLPPRAPFDLLFFDAGGLDGTAIDLVSPGGLIVKDDLTPGRPVDGDAVRELLLRDPRLVGVEILTSPTAAAIVAVRTRAG